MNRIKNELYKKRTYKKRTYKKWTYKLWIIKNERIKNEHIKNELIKKELIPPRSNLTPTPTPSWTSTTPLYTRCCQAVRILLLQRSCKPFIVSSVTPPYIKKYIRGQDPVVLCACTFFKLYCLVASGRQSLKNMVSNAFQLAWHDWSGSFSR